VILALDVGGTFIKSALFRAGELQRLLPQVPSCSGGSAEEIGSALRRAVTAAGEDDGIGVAIPGPFDYRNGVSLMEHKFRAIKGKSLLEFLPDVPVRFIHDANAFLLGEVTFGSVRDCERVGGITLGTGLGAAFAVRGKLLVGTDGSPAAEVKLWNAPFRNGIAEDYISGRALLAAYPAESVKAVADAARRGNRVARQVWLEYGSALFELLTTWRERLKPEWIVIGGQISRDFHLFGPVPNGLSLCRTTLGENAALYGAFEYSRRMLKDV